MRAYIKNLFLLPTLIVALGMIPVGRVLAQTFTNLHSFTALSHSTNNDGTEPYAGLILSSNTLYGTAYYGGSSGRGILFAVNTNGTGFTNLHSFTATIGNAGYNASGTNSDGANPHSELIMLCNTLYGTAENGGSSGNGTVFAVNTNGTGFTNLHSFTAWNINSLGNPTNSDGISPRTELIISGTTLYGTAQYGGNSASGTIFKLNTNGMGFATLHSFTATPQTSWINSDGVGPNGLILSSNILYGTAVLGGSSGNGTVFAVNTNGTGFMTLHSFTACKTNSVGVYTNSDGVQPKAGLILSGNTLYGTASSGGSFGFGTVFAVNTNGTGFTNLYNFSSVNDGSYPYAGLIISDNTLYGTAGSVFAVNTDGTGFRVLHGFTGGSDGVDPNDVILSGNILYGTASGGGSSGNGTVFSISLPPPQLTIIYTGTNVILTWPTYAPGITLQSTTNFVSQAVWSANSPAPSIVNGQNAVTNAISSMQMFYRLSQ